LAMFAGYVRWSLPMAMTYVGDPGACEGQMPNAVAPIFSDPPHRQYPSDPMGGR
jgi:hypothetical protein